MYKGVTHYIKIKLIWMVSLKILYNHKTQAVLNSFMVNSSFEN